MLSKILDMKGSEIIDLCNNIPQHYYHFQIPKRNGTYRSIKAPDSILKEAQRKLLYNLFYKFKAHDIAHGFITEKNPKSNAQTHQRAGVILTMDIENFFPSIGRDDVIKLLKSLFSSDPKKFEFIDEKITWLPRLWEHIADLTTLYGHLPQGAPCSPVIANLHCYRMDGELKKLAMKNKCIVTRYADDITFSHKDPRFDIGKLIKETCQIVRKYHFSLNKEKTRISRPNRRMEITGVVINRGHNAPKSYRKLIRAKVHNYVIKKQNTDEEVLRGEIEWIRYLNPIHAQPLLKKLGWKIAPDSNEFLNQISP